MAETRIIHPDTVTTAYSSDIQEEMPKSTTSDDPAIVSTTEDKLKVISPASTPTSTSPIPSRRSLLLSELRFQLEYYFSPANLQKDTFLCSVMSNSRTLQNQRQPGRHCPIFILARFANVNRIISRYFEEVERSNLEKDETTITDDVPTLLQEAAFTSSVLEVVTLAPNGPMDNEILQIGIGPRTSSALPYEPDFNEGAVNHSISSVAESNHNNSNNSSNNGFKKQSERNTVILRDMPHSSTEEEVRSIFSWEGCPKVKDVHSDVMNCWFVTLDASESQVVDALLKLRGQKFNGEPIKARLKTESTVKQYSTFSAMSVPPQPQDVPVNNNNNNGGFYSRPSGPPRRNGSGGYKSPQRFKENSSHDKNAKGKLGRRLNSPKAVKKEEVQQIVSPSPPPLLDSQVFPALGGSKTLSTPVKETSTVWKDKPVGEANNKPPPLAASTIEKAPDPVPVSMETKKSVGGYAAALLKAAPPKPPATPETKPSSGRSSPSSLEQKKTKEQSPKPSEDKMASPKKPNEKASITPRKPNNNVKLITPNKKSTPKKSKANPQQDDSSSSTKSSICSKTEADTTKASPPAAIAPAAWGGKKTFADILKTKQQQQPQPQECIEEVPSKKM